MYDIPLKVEELAVEVAEDVTIYMRPLSDDQYFRFIGGASIKRDHDDVEIKLPASEFGAIFQENLARVEGEIRIGGEPFSQDNLQHIRNLPQGWKALAVTEVINYAMDLPPESGKDSRSPDELQPEDTQPPEV